MIEGRKILITGPAGQIAFPLAKALAECNEVWGIARFSDAEKRREVEAVGVRTLTIDLERADFSDLPRDFTHLLHLAVSFDPNYSRAISVNAEGTGLLLSHCRNVEAALVMSTHLGLQAARGPVASLPRGRSPWATSCYPPCRPIASPRFRRRRSPGSARASSASS